MNIISILRGTIYYFWEFCFFNTFTTICSSNSNNLSSKMCTYSWTVTCLRHAKNVLFMEFQWSKAQFFLSRLWITIHFLKGLCMNSIIKLVKLEWRSLQTRTLLGSYDSWNRGLCPYGWLLKIYTFIPLTILVWASCIKLLLCASKKRHSHAWKQTIVKSSITFQNAL